MPTIKILVTAILLLLCAEGSMETIVTTNIGRISGLKKVIDLDGKRKILTEFFGIPYAEDTSGKNRFRRPVPKAPFNETFHAFTISPPCMQKDILNAFTSNMTEDCLMLNIYVPLDLSTYVGSKLLPVMIWIHGGAFISGTASFYNGEALSSVGEVIIVTINYRLAEFGFLNVGDTRANGNQGLWDQKLAIQWVKKHILAFKGDPDEITIFGESAGAMSVTLQTLHAGNKGLFKRAIAESGSALTRWGAAELPNVDRLYELSGCDNGSADPVECLKGMSATELLAVLNKPEMADCCSSSPTLDHEFLLERPLDIVFGKNNISNNAREFFQTLDIMMGVNNGEGALYILMTWPRLLGQVSMNNMTVTPTDMKNIASPFVIANSIKPPNNESFSALSNAISFEYTNWKEHDNIDFLRRSLMKLSSDTVFFVPAVQTVEAHSPSHKRTYFYEFTAEPPVRSVPTPVWFHGANHGDELFYVFGYPFLNASTPLIPTSREPNVTQADKNLALGIMTAWSNFAISGNPNMPVDTKTYLHASWPEYDRVNQRFLQIALNSSSEKQHFNARSTTFWTRLIPAILEDTSMWSSYDVHSFNKTLAV